MTQGEDAPVVQAQPTPFSYRFDEVGKITLSSGDEVALVRMIIFMQTGNTVIFMDAPTAGEFSDRLRGVAAGGLTIARDLGGMDI